MKKVFLILLLCPGIKIMAQNFGINTSDPRNALHVVGSILSTSPTIASTTPPTPAKTFTLVNNTNSFVFDNDSVAHCYDPGGPSGNYLPNLIAWLIVEGTPYNTAVGIEVTIESVQLGTGDSIIIRETGLSVPFLTIGSSNAVTGKWIFNTAALIIRFQSNADASVGSGFSIRVRRLYSNAAIVPSVNGFAGNSFFFDANRGALRSGLLNAEPMGTHSTATGYKNTASGNNSTAMGIYNIASAYGAVALGQGCTSSGNNAVAMGSVAQATGNYAVAMGYHSIAGGASSTSLGYFTTASGNYSTAMGYYVSTNGKAGSFTIGDASTTSIMTSPAANNFRARFANGYRLYTSADYSTSCSLGAGDNAWSTSSDMRLKENFAPIDGDDILKKIAAMPLVTWNYKKQDPSQFRHYGPMAQDFFAAFGKDMYGTIGNDSTINQSDFAGVSFVAIQALIKQNKGLQSTVEELVEELKQLKATQERQQKELEAIRKRCNPDLY
jgi:hypothetical protein